MVKLSTVAAGVVALLGVAGLMRGAMPLNAASSSSASSGMAGMDMGSSGSSSSGAVAGGSAGQGGPMEVTRAYVQEPANPEVVAAYFSVYNNTGSADTLVSVQSGAANETTLHTDENMDVASSGLALPPHKTVALSVGHGHVMMQQVIGTLKPGQTVNLILNFAHAAPVTVAAPVIAIGAPTP